MSKISSWFSSLLTTIKKFFKFGSDTTEDTTSVDTTPIVTPSGKDEVDFSVLKWTYGGFAGGSAVYSEGQPTIKSLSLNAKNLYYAWNGVNLDVWGYSNSQAGAVCAVFFKNSAGEYVGGKFDWISTSRLSRGLENCFSGYNGWSTSGLPNPCDAAFVIMNPDRKRRSNVIVAKWNR